MKPREQFVKKHIHDWTVHGPVFFDDSTSVIARRCRDCGDYQVVDRGEWRKAAAVVPASLHPIVDVGWREPSESEIRNIRRTFRGRPQ